MYRYIILIFCICFLTNEAYAQEQIYITYDAAADGIVFDGMWSHKTEWKATSLTDVQLNEKRFVIRSGHDYENLYIMINFVTDSSVEKNSDKAIVCIDGNMDKAIIPDNDDYCFLLRMGSDSPITLQGGSNIPNKNYFKTIQNHEELVGVANISDQHDRYSKIPHSVYEYKIPLEIFGKSDVYGFFVSVYDDKTKEWQSWPKNIVIGKYPFIPSPDLWGELISPDKSIPEFGSIMLLFSIVLSIMILWNRLYIKNKNSDYRPNPQSTQR